MTIKEMKDYLKCQHARQICVDCSLRESDCGLGYEKVIGACIDILERIEKCNDKSATKCHECISLIKDRYKEECK